MVLAGGLRSVGLSCLGGVGGFALARIIYPDVTYQENPRAINKVCQTPVFLLFTSNFII